MKKRAVIDVSVGLIAVIGCASVLYRVVNGDWGGRPTIAEVVAAGSQLRLPLGKERVDAYSKVTIIAQTRESSTTNPDQVEAQFLALAKNGKWTRKDVVRSNGGVIFTYCDGKFARIMEMTGAHPTYIYAGTFWTSNRNSDFYCR